MSYKLQCLSKHFAPLPRHWFRSSFDNKKGETVNLVTKLVISILFLLITSLSYASNAVTVNCTDKASNLKKILSCYQEKTFIISTFKKYPLSLTVAEIIKSAYSKLGMQVEIRYLPGKRSLHYSNSGHADAELFRIKGIGNKFHNLIPIPVVLMEIETIAYAKRNDIAINGWASLKPYKIGFLRGFKKAEINTRGMQVYFAEQMSSLFALLVKGRVDLVIESRLGGKYSLDPEVHIEIKPLDPPIEKFEVFHYLHRTNKSLVAELTKVLLQMEASGEIRNIIETMIEGDFKPLL
ncbi:MAG: hypothetical protein OFPI_09490 [Osedax symbiont Rs2]|nr:MAG: hypothetical protein OFPI_09490 [Osedax symbiont Rs2]